MNLLVAPCSFPWYGVAKMLWFLYSRWSGEDIIMVPLQSVDSLLAKMLWFLYSRWCFPMISWHPANSEFYSIFCMLSGHFVVCAGRLYLWHERFGTNNFVMFPLRLVLFLFKVHIGYARRIEAIGFNMIYCLCLSTARIKTFKQGCRTSTR